VHGKGSLINKMPGDEWQRFSNLRTLYCWQFLHPGKPLLFMGGEFAQSSEWDSDSTIDWALLQQPLHLGIQRLVSELNRLYRSQEALYRYEFEQRGFEWVDCHDREQSVLSFLRRGEGAPLLVVFNLTPVPRHDYRIGVPQGGRWRELFNSDASLFGGSGLGNLGGVDAEAHPWMGREYSVSLLLPPLAALVFAAGEQS
jgi:1,4-alpha-glucan branching enzyme